MKTPTTLLLSSLLILALSSPARAGAAGGQDHAQHHDPHAQHEAAAAQPQDEHAEHRQMMEHAAPVSPNNVSIKLSDLELRDQDGRRQRLASDVIGDKIAAMTFVYSSCTTICPIYSALFTEIQNLLGDRLGREVVLVTLTLDPTTDVPLRLKREAKKYSAKPGWYYLTGQKRNVDQVLRGLDAYFADFTQHPPMALIGDGRTGTWKRFNGFPQPEQIVAIIDELAAARKE